MHRLLPILIAFFASHFLKTHNALAEMPRREPFSARDWNAFTAQSFLLLFPEHEGLARRTPVRIDKNSGVLAAIDYDPRRDVTTIIVSRGMINLASSEGEYLFVAAHEFAHVLKGHRPTREIVRWFRTIRSVHDVALLKERADAEADAIAVQALRRKGYDPCSALRLFQKLDALLKLTANPKSLSYELNVRRRRFLISQCPGALDP
jgi:hypothetical protein